MCDRNKVLEIVNQCGKDESKLLEILLEVQNASDLNYISKENAKLIAEALGIPLSRVYEVISFYSMLSLHPRGRYVIEVCNSSACHVKGGKKMLEMIEELLGVSAGEATEDKHFYIEEVSCFGACDVAPAIKIGPKVYGNLTREKLNEIINSYRRV